MQETAAAFPYVVPSVTTTRREFLTVGVLQSITAVPRNKANEYLIILLQKNITALPLERRSTNKVVITPFYVV